MSSGFKYQIDGDLNTEHHDDGRVTLYGVERHRGPIEIELSDGARRWLLAALKAGSRRLNDEEN